MTRSTLRKWRDVALLSLLLAILSGAPALAGELVGDVTYILPEGQTIEHNLHVLSNSARIDGVVKGDLIVGSSGTVVINGRVEGDVVVGGGSVEIVGTVTGDVRGVAVRFEVASKGEIGGDLLLAAGNVVVDGTVTGDVQILVRRTTVGGTVGGSLDVLGTSLSVSGVVKGSVHTHGANVEFLSSAQVDGDVVVTRELVLADGASIQGSSRQVGSTGRPLQVQAALVLAWIIWTLVMLLLGPAVNWAGPQWLMKATKEVSSAPVGTLMRGLALWLIPWLFGASMFMLASGLRGDFKPVLQLTAFVISFVSLTVVGAAAFVGLVPVLAGLGRRLSRGKMSYYAGYVMSSIAFMLLIQISILRVPLALLLGGLGAGAIFSRERSDFDGGWFVEPTD
jgi:cytoskeletal protein CcmA (bactofilin family)